MPLTSISKERLEAESANLRDETLETYNFPEGRILEVDGIKYKAFTLEEYKEIAYILVAYESIWDDSDLIQEQNLSLEQERKLWVARVNIWKQTCDLQKERGDIYSKLWESEHLLRLKVQRQQTIVTWIPWTVVILESIALTTFGIYQVAK